MLNITLLLTDTSLNVLKAIEQTSGSLAAPPLFSFTIVSQGYALMVLFCTNNTGNRQQLNKPPPLFIILMTYRVVLLQGSGHNGKVGH